ncbi:hypothetical protein DENSPDRAFT_837878 [Dentipellis sp. KUC8613]|nr:hypothetical protein DENSPDRAFT_837878 [Dentipellis sp. KUC8613]
MTSSEAHPPGYDLGDSDHQEPSHEAVTEATAMSATSAASSPQDPQATSTLPAASAEPPHTSPPATGTEQDPNAPSLPERPQEDEFADPQVASLHAIFPDFDAETLHSILASVGGDQDAAVDALLGMSDPNYVPTTQPSQPMSRTQTELDEEFARQLLIQDEQEAQSRRRGAQSFPFQPRQHGPAHPHPPTNSPPAQERDTMTEMQEQFSKIAESGKRTFSSLVSKVKAKVQEFDQQRNAQGSSEARTQPSWGASSGPQNVDRHSQQAYYAPTNAEPYPRRSSVGLEYEDAPYRGAPLAPAPKPASPAAVPDDPTKITPGSGIPQESSATPPPPRTSSGPPPSNIDAGKFGLLPKRPVSLIPTEQPAHTVRGDDDSEELEYVENPFEEGHH